jgi:uncharacterized protein
MRLEHSFSIPVGIDAAWAALLDVERIAPCMPGAAVTSTEGDEFTGSVKVRLGPITLLYKGKARIVEKDEAQHHARIYAQGRDARGNGTAAATVSATLTPEGSATRVDVVTDLDITGKPAQFGRGVMVDVGNKLIGQFADCLAAELAGGIAPQPAATSASTGAATAASTAGASPTGTEASALSESSLAGAPLISVTQPQPDGREPAPTSSRPAAGAEPINLMSSAGPAVLKRLVPVFVAAAAVVVAVVRLRHRSARPSPATRTHRPRPAALRR